MLRFVKNYSVELLLSTLFALSLLFFLHLYISMSDVANFINTLQLHQISTLFLSIFFEGLPFLLIGVLLSSLIQAFVKEDWLWKWAPKNPLLSLPIATTMGLFLPICECGIVPVAKRLIEKKLPAYTVFTFLLAAPIVNPITIFSTYIAFGNHWGITVARTLVGAFIAIAIGFLFFLFFRDREVLKKSKTNEHDHSCCDHQHNDTNWKEKADHALYHAIFEFFNMGKYFVLGAFLAASFQTLVGFSVIESISAHPSIAILFMMGIAFGLSICSSSDAFIAASFRNAMGNAPLFGFIIYGPMMDLKNVLMMIDSFRPSVIWFFCGTTTLLTFLTISFLF